MAKNLLDLRAKRVYNESMKIMIIESKTHGTHHVLLDDEDYDRVAQRGKWQITRSKRKHSDDVFYVNIGPRKGKGGGTSIHRFIMKPPKGMVVDHINHNGLDNRKENLRICTQTENMRNNRASYGEVPFKGVIDDSERKGHLRPYRAEVRRKNSGNFIGYYATPEEAAIAYDEAAKEEFGEFAYLNFPHGPPADVIHKIIKGREKYEKWKKSYEAEKQSPKAGVCWNVNRKFWHVEIRRDNKRIHIGNFQNEEEAIAARLAAEKGIFPATAPYRRSSKQSSQPGVQWEDSKARWIARISINGKPKYLGSFNTEEEAVATRLNAEQGIFPEKKQNTPGVCRAKWPTGSAWRATITINGKFTHLGTFKTEEEAIEVRLKAERGIFPEKKQKQKGVNWSKKYKNWRANIYINGVQKHLGTFKTEQEAIAARLKAEKEKTKI